jgi:hypothetical protein
MLGVVLIAIVLSGEIASGEEASERWVRDIRLSEGIPDRERSMSLDELINGIYQKEMPWATEAILLRGRIADAEARRAEHRYLLERLQSDSYSTESKWYIPDGKGPEDGVQLQKKRFPVREAAAEGLRIFEERLAREEEKLSR